MNRPPIIAREGWGIIAVLAAATLAIAYWNPWAALLPGALLALSVYFFRDPERSIPGGEQEVVAPADGRVMFVKEVEEPRFLKGRARVVSIFLSVFDVHINRAPVSGLVTYKEYVPGKFVAAWDENVEQINERQYLGVESGGRRVLVVQIAGLLARRIICRPQPGDRLARGDRFGLIKFGSCTQVFLPPDTEIHVREGDVVRGGSSVIGRMKE